MGPVGTRVSLSRAGSTGGFQPDEGTGERTVEGWVSPRIAAGDARPRGPGGVEEQHRRFRHSRARAPLERRRRAVRRRVVRVRLPAHPRWPADDERLIQALAESGRTLLVHDNLGRLMVELPPGDSAGLRPLSHWLHEQVEGHVVVPYLDVRALTERAKNVLQANCSRVVD